MGLGKLVPADALEHQPPIVEEEIPPANLDAADADNLAGLVLARPLQADRQDVQRGILGRPQARPVQGKRQRQPDGAARGGDLLSRFPVRQDRMERSFRRAVQFRLDATEGAAAGGVQLGTEGQGIDEAPPAALDPHVADQPAVEPSAQRQSENLAGVADVRADDVSTVPQPSGRDFQAIRRPGGGLADGLAVEKEARAGEHTIRAQKVAVALGVRPWAIEFPFQGTLSHRGKAARHAHEINRLPGHGTLPVTGKINPLATHVQYFLSARHKRFVRHAADP